jgi:hypothetical protein
MGLLGSMGCQETRMEDRGVVGDYLAGKIRALFFANENEETHV